MTLTRRELARLLTRIENDEAAEDLARLYPQTGRAHIIGVTGSPGAGKSTLVNALARHYRAHDQTVAILAVDPTSPFSGGAILGDRVRMQDLAGDPGVFIRSMATRGALGGVAPTTLDMARALDAAGFARILIETVGAGQSEVEIARAAQTTLVVEAPGMGDDVQTLKAGILEIADILVVNKADRPGAEGAVRALRAMLELGHGLRNEGHHGRQIVSAQPPESSAETWLPPVLQTVASTGAGVPELAAQIDAHYLWLQNSGEGAARMRAQLAAELETRLRAALYARLLSQVDQELMKALLNRMETREITLYFAVDLLLKQLR